MVCCNTLGISLYILRVTGYNFQTKSISFVEDYFVIANIVDPDVTNDRFQSHISFFVNTFFKIVKFWQEIACTFKTFITHCLVIEAQHNYKYKALVVNYH